MRIAYLTFNWPRTKQSGVGQKILTQMSAWQALGHTVGYFMHAHPHVQPQELIPGTHAFYRDLPGLVGKIQREFSRAAAMAKILTAVRAFQPDVIYLRSGRFVYPLQTVFGIAPVILEINGQERAQERMQGRLAYAYHRLTAPWFYSKVSGMVTISRQLAELPDLARTGKPILALGNSFDVAGTQPFPAPANPVPRLVFMGSPGNPWHGVDKLVQLARASADLMIDVVGYDHLAGVDELPANLVLHGYLDKTAYLRVLAQGDVAIGSMGLHRAQLAENSLLKTRECLAYGLPMILPYRDTDLEDLQVDWLLSIPNREDNLITHAEAIREFAYRMRGQRADRSVVLERLDAGRKEAQRVEFFRQICEARI